MPGPPVLLLGAGHGRRMGGPKLFTRHGGQTFLERILRRCQESASPVTLTVDPLHQKQLALLLATLDLPRPRLALSDGSRDMLFSVQQALGMNGWTPGFWLWPVDAPFLSPEGWRTAVERAAHDPGSIWKLRHQGRTGHPIWYPEWTVAPILKGGWDDGLLGFLREVPPAKIQQIILENEVIADFNTPRALQQLSR